MTAVSHNAVGSGQRFFHLVVHEFRYDLRCFRRNTQSLFFTLILPVLFLAIFASVFRNANVKVPGGRIGEAVYYVPGIIAYGIIAAAFSNLVVTVVRIREAGTYKRQRATPLPAGAIIIGRALIGAVTALAIAAVLLAIGWAAYGASFPGRMAPAVALDIIVGALAFCCLGFALTTVITSVDAALPGTLAIVLPLCFISGVFIPAGELPNWLINIGAVFPVRALAASLLAAYNPHTTGAGLNWGDLAVLAAWGGVGFIVALRRFRWLPRSG
jgi:ABC-2 type transport system permease protein